MREAIRQLLINGVEAVEGRVFEPHAMTTQDGLPALIVRFTADETAPDHLGVTQTVEIWPYTARERFTDLDALALDVKATLDEAHFTEVLPDGTVMENGRHYYAEHRRTGTDTADEQ